MLFMTKIILWMRRSKITNGDFENNTEKKSKASKKNNFFEAFFVEVNKNGTGSNKKRGEL